MIVGEMVFSGEILQPIAFKPLIPDAFLNKIAVINEKFTPG
jgi:hypothetical protein